MFLAFFLFVAILRLQFFGVYRMAESYGSCSLAVNCFKNVQVSKCQNQWEVKILFVVHPCRAPVNAILSVRAKLDFPMDRDCRALAYANSLYAKFGGLYSGNWLRSRCVTAFTASSMGNMGFEIRSSPPLKTLLIRLSKSV